MPGNAMRKPILALASAVMLSAAAAAQQPSPSQQTASPSPPQQTTSPSQPASASPAAQSVRVRKGTLLKLETLQALDPGTARPGDDVPLRFRRALYVEGVTLIPRAHCSTEPSPKPRWPDRTASLARL